MTEFARSMSFEGHPSLAGHFPGNPVIPGVVLLEKVLATCKAWLPELQVSGLDSVKFLLPVRPGDRFEIALRRDADDVIRFRCVDGERLFASGILRCQFRS